jgi:sec-independent protein translocase protein TatA
MNLGAPEILLILVVALLVFGPHRLPEIGRQVGGAMRELRRVQNSVKSEINAVMQEDAPSYDAKPVKPVSATPTEVGASMLDTPAPVADTTTAAAADAAPAEEPSADVVAPAPEPGFDGPAGSFR